MKITRCLIPLFILAAAAVQGGEPSFPGLKAIMSEADWKSAKLDRLEAGDVQLINEAFARYLAGAAIPASALVVPPPNEEVKAPAKKHSLWERFGLGAAAEEKPREKPLMQAKATAWHGNNGFELDNGQVWEGIDPIHFDLVGKAIGIQEGRLGSFLLVIEGKDTTVRLHRIK